MTDNNIVAGSPRSGNRWYPDRLAAGLPPAPALQPVALGRTSQDEWAQSAPSRQRAKDRVAFSKTGLAKVDQTVTWLGHPLSLTATESSIVALLSSRPGESTPLIELYKIIKPDESRLMPSAKDRQNVVLSAIKELRRKFRDVDQSFSAMTFQPGKGFIWDENQ
jgi:DNA-binding response OmpR family regulator